MAPTRRDYVVYVTILLLIASLVSVTLADVYLHNPRGSNNRLNERGQNRDNANRQFDSQNNDKGGYAWGPQMYFYTGSRLPIEWTNQHSCADPKTHCQIILQYSCSDEAIQEDLGWPNWRIRDGTTTQSIPTPSGNIEQDLREGATEKVVLPTEFQSPAGSMEPKPACLSGEGDTCVVHKYGMQEPVDFYLNCRKRERNKGLFIADQKVGPKAINTRQNPNGQRHGFECPEERDYYPYWHPSPWKDIAVITSDPSMCDYYQSNSQNNEPKGYCTVADFNNPAACKQGGGEWKESLWRINTPECRKAEWSRDNHLGNTRSGLTMMYNWTIPDDAHKFCVLRVRYNVSTGDYPFDLDARANGENSPIKQDPFIAPFNGRPLRLALNTDQYGRTFEDRSYTFEIRSRPSDIAVTEKIHNVNVRGKRGNIVQVYPAVEYDFTPTELHVRTGDQIHFQWTGSDFSPQGNEGEGTKGTDRSNIVFIKDLSKNYDGPQGFFQTAEEIERFAYLDMPSKERCAADLAEIVKTVNGKEQQNQDPRNCAKLNAASRYFDGGLTKLVAAHNWQHYSYMNTRNNNFSNRSQKGAIIVVPFIPIWAIVMLSVGALILFAAIFISAAAFFVQRYPHTRAGRLIQRVLFAGPEFHERRNPVSL